MSDVTETPTVKFLRNGKEVVNNPTAPDESCFRMTFPAREGSTFPSVTLVLARDAPLAYLCVGDKSAQFLLVKGGNEHEVVLAFAGEEQIARRDGQGNIQIHGNSFQVMRPAPGVIGMASGLQLFSMRTPFEVHGNCWIDVGLYGTSSTNTERLTFNRAEGVLGAADMKSIIQASASLEATDVGHGVKFSIAMRSDSAQHVLTVHERPSSAFVVFWPLA